MPNKYDERITDFVAAVRAAAVEKRTTLEAVAEGIGITRVTLSNKMNFHVSFNFEEVLAICDYLDLDTALFLGKCN